MQKKQIFKCDVCGNVVELLHVGGGQLVCCGEDMQLLKEQTEDSSKEKHVPFIQQKGDQVVVRIGQNQDHPMEEKHYIEWIELIADGKSYRQFLQPGDQPQAVFCVTGNTLAAREYCNVHGLWKT